MFEDSLVDEKRRPPSFWLKVVLVVAFALIVINIFRVNPPTDKVAVKPPPVEDTKGPVVQNVILVDPGSFVPYRISFPYSSILKGRFRVDKNGTRILVIVLDDENAGKYRERREYSSLVSTGRNPSGVVDRKLEAGTYYLIFDNRDGFEQVIVNADFVVE